MYIFLLSSAKSSDAIFFFYLKTQSESQTGFFQEWFLTLIAEQCDVISNVSCSSYIVGCLEVEEIVLNEEGKRNFQVQEEYV